MICDHMLHFSRFKKSCKFAVYEKIDTVTHNTIGLSSEIHCSSGISLSVVGWCVRQSSCVAQAGRDSLFSYLCIPSAGITDVCHVVTRTS